MITIKNHQNVRVINEQLGGGTSKMTSNNECRVVIDERGKHWDCDSKELREHFDSALGTEGLIQFLVANLGWIDLRYSERLIEARCRPRLLTDIACMELMYFLADRSTAKLTISVLGSNWANYNDLNLTKALSIIGALQKCHQGTKYPAFDAVPISANDSPLFDRLVAVLSSVEGNMHADLDSVVDTLSRVFRNQRWSISHFDQSDGKLTMDRKGKGFTPFNKDWCSNLSSGSLADYAGSDYANWVATTRKRVIESNCPIFDEVDAMVVFPTVGLSRLVYSRVTAPITLTGKRYAISAAESSSAILRT